MPAPEKVQLARVSGAKDYSLGAKASPAGDHRLWPTRSSNGGIEPGATALVAGGQRR